MGRRDRLLLWPFLLLRACGVESCSLPAAAPVAPGQPPGLAGECCFASHGVKCLELEELLLRAPSEYHWRARASVLTSLARAAIRSALIVLRHRLPCHQQLPPELVQRIITFLMFDTEG